MSPDAAEPVHGDVVHRHNLMPGAAENEPRFGLRLRLPAGDTFSSILGDAWEKTRWYHSENERDQAIRALRRQHPYYRIGDRPTLVFEKINRS